MADLVITSTIQDRSVNTRPTYGAKNTNFATEGDAKHGFEVKVSSTEYVLTIDAGIQFKGPISIVNSDATNSVDLGFATGVYSMKLSPGIPANFELAEGTAALYMIASAGDCFVRGQIFERRNP